MATLIGFIFFHYDRASASYLPATLGLADFQKFFAQPEMSLLGKLLRQTVFLSVYVFAYSFGLSFAFLLARKLRETALMSLLLSLCFIVPAILKSYSWAHALSVIPLWDYFALPAFLAVSLSVFYFSAITARVNSLGLNTLVSLDEYFSRFRLVVELMKFCIGPAIFAALCIFSVVLFSGIEIEHLGRNVVTFTDVVSGFFGGREQEAGFLALIALLFIGTISGVAVKVLWDRII